MGVNLLHYLNKLREIIAKIKTWEDKENPEDVQEVKLKNIKLTKSTEQIPPTNQMAVPNKA